MDSYIIHIITYYCMQLFAMNLVKMMVHVIAQIYVHVLLDGQILLVIQVKYTVVKWIGYHKTKNLRDNVWSLLTVADV